MDIRSVMTANPATCTPDATLRQVAQMMKQNDCGQIPVVGQDRQPLGVITDRDIAMRMVAEGGDPASATAGDYMTAPATTVSDQCSLDDVAKVMEREQIRRVVVVDDQGKVAGIVAQADIALAGRDGKTAEVVKQVSEPGRSH
ncbi:CBS domain-containing protein [Cognatiluteimonas telluris]|uniref:CBS domain-containing protein n=1 Tax=Cognatiluteimonas telluris TaxID=1104775 RepID=UPI001A9C4E3D|nr:CBS domain-containing protein [Lysobacter telluris]